MSGKECLEISDDYKYDPKTYTKGNQVKYFKDNYFYKLDMHGHEGYVETLVSKLLSFMKLDDRLDYVTYNECIVNGTNACKSLNFLKHDEQVVSMSRLYRMLGNKGELSDKLFGLPDAKTRLDYLVDIVSKFGIYGDIFKIYLNTLFQLDILVKNSDRHMHNICYIVNSKREWRPAPIFDNGHSLDTDFKNETTSCSISGVFEEQLLAFSFPYQPVITFDNNEVSKFIHSLPRTHEVIVLSERLEKYGYLFKKE